MWLLQQVPTPHQGRSNQVGRGLPLQVWQQLLQLPEAAAVSYGCFQGMGGSCYVLVPCTQLLLLLLPGWGVLHMTAAGSGRPAATAAFGSICRVLRSL
jgi:hypothetical protein